MDGTRGKVVALMTAFAAASLTLSVTLAILMLPAPTGLAQARVFEDGAIDLALDGPRGVDGFVGSTNLAPGDRVSGALVLYANVGSDAPADLDLVLRREGDTTTPSPLAQALVLTRLAYGRDDLLTLTDAGLDVVPLLDADGDGQVTLSDLERGIHDLPPPRTRPEGGTPLTLEVQFQPTRDQEAYHGETLGVDFVFVLADASAEDLR